MLDIIGAFFKVQGNGSINIEKMLTVEVSLNSREHLDIVKLIKTNKRHFIYLAHNQKRLRLRSEFVDLLLQENKPHNRQLLQQTAEYSTKACIRNGWFFLSHDFSSCCVAALIDFFGLFDEKELNDFLVLNVDAGIGNFKDVFELTFNNVLPWKTRFIDSALFFRRAYIEHYSLFN